ncbi:AtuA-related protein [Giesbergeria giesbergeri]
MTCATAPTITVPLYRLAHSRTGDKGNRSNISIIAWHPALWDTLVDQVTESAVARQFALRQPRQVTRYLLPQLQAMNIVLDDVLDGGVNDALNLDSHGKALSYLLLDLPVQVPAALVQHFGGPRS